MGADLAEAAGNLLGRETVEEIAFASSRMVPVLALVAAEGIREDVQKREGISNGTKLRIAGLCGDIAIAAVSTLKSKR